MNKMINRLSTLFLGLMLALFAFSSCEKDKDYDDFVAAPTPEDTTTNNGDNSGGENNGSNENRPDDSGGSDFGAAEATYIIKGKVVVEENRTPYEGARILIKRGTVLENGVVGLFSQPVDTLYTDQEGTYLFKESTLREAYCVVCQDPKGVYRTDSAFVFMNPTYDENNVPQGDSRDVNFLFKKK